MRKSSGGSGSATNTTTPATTTKSIDDARKTSDSNSDGGGDGKIGSKLGSQTNGNNNKRKIYVSSNKASLALSAAEQNDGDKGGNQVEIELGVKRDDNAEKAEGLEEEAQ